MNLIAFMVNKEGIKVKAKLFSEIIQKECEEESVRIKEIEKEGFK